MPPETLRTPVIPTVSRIPALDAARGLALLGMFAFHLTWDLAFFQLIPPATPFSPAMMNFGHLVAISFLAIAGASLALASRAGMNWRAYWRRLAMVGGAAAGITVATLFVFPDEFIFFGILHCIAVASVLALPFLSARPWLALAVAIAFVLAPHFVASPAFDNYLGWSLGLSERLPNTNDWRPVFPWAGATFAGVGLMRLALTHGLPAGLIAWEPRGAPARALIWGGRHSLLVYLVHQPVFLAFVWLAAQVLPPVASPVAVSEDASFADSCVAACASTDDQRDVCARLCACVAETTHAEGLWRPMLASRLTPDQSVRVGELSRQCAARSQ